MDTVNHFNAELSSLYDVKPPISKGKMTAITKAALKAVKFYKHVVQSVEKFIQKCKPEYKIPGLYVIDSIIRQSRHQFGPDKDIFAGRFQRNLQTTFVHLYRCPEEDKSKVIRVLNLWQKNRIFMPEAIQPLFDLADPNNPIWETVNVQQAEAYGGGNESSSQPSLGGGGGGMSQGNDQHPIHFKKELLDYDYDEEDEDGTGMSASGHSHSHSGPPPPQMSHIQMGNVHNELTQSAFSGLDALGSILTNPEVLRQLQTLQEQMAAASGNQMGYLTPEQERQRKLAELNKQEAAFDQRLAQTVARLPFAVECDLPFPDSTEKTKSPKREGGVPHPSNSVDQNSNHQQNPGLLLPPPFFQQLNAEHLQQMLPTSSDQHHQSINMSLLGNPPPISNPFGIPISFPMQTAPPHYQQHDPALSQQNPNQFNPQQLQQLREVGNLGFPVQFKTEHLSQFDHNVNFDEDMGVEDHRDRDRDRRDRDRGVRSGERNRMRSRSRSGSPRRRGSRSNSRTRSRKRHGRSRSRSRDRKEKEREKERQRKGLPSVKREYLSVCSTTLWVGHLSKLVSQEEISDTFGSYGDVISIDLILPRGCAFVVMNRRQDACRALDRLKNSKLQSKAITLAWAPGKGVKGRDWKDYWEVEAGVSYIPWSKLTAETNLEDFEDGGSIDEDSLPDFLKKQYKAINTKEEKKEDNEATKVVNSDLKEDSKHFTTNQSSNPIQNIPPLLPPASENVKTNDMEVRHPVDVTVTVTSEAPTMTQVNPSLASPFTLPPPSGMLNMSSMAMNMMIPPPMLGNPMCLPPHFQGLNSLTNINMPMLGMLPPNMGPGMPQDPSGIKPLSGGQGLLGEMPLPQQGLSLQMKNPNTSDFGDRMNDETRKRRPDGDRRENREKKRSRFNDADERTSPINDPERRTPPTFDRLKDQPLFERLKNMAGGYGFGGHGNNDKLNSVLGPPPLIPGGFGPRGSMDHRMSEPRGFPTPLLPRGGHPGQFGAPRGPPFSGERQSGPRSWFDASQNPFVHQNSQNPFAGNPFIQPPVGNPNENPFELRDGAGASERGGRGQFFGSLENHYGRGRGWARGEGPLPPNNWRDPTRGGRGGPPGSGPGRMGPSWRGRNSEEDLGSRDLDRDRNFRGGRGRDLRDRGNEYGDRRRDWDRDRGRDRSERERDSREPRDREPTRGRDREREHDRGDYRDRERNRDSRFSSRENRSRRNDETKISKIDVGDLGENWEDDIPSKQSLAPVKTDDSLTEESWEPVDTPIKVEETKNGNGIDTSMDAEADSPALPNQSSTEEFVSERSPQVENYTGERDDSEFDPPCSSVNSGPEIYSRDPPSEPCYSEEHISNEKPEQEFSNDQEDYSRPSQNQHNQDSYCSNEEVGFEEEPPSEKERGISPPPPMSMSMNTFGGDDDETDERGEDESDKPRHYFREETESNENFNSSHSDMNKINLDTNSEANAVTTGDE